MQKAGAFGASWAAILLFASCAPRGQSIPEPGTLAPVAPSQMEFREGSGREVIDVAQVTSVDISVYATFGPNAEPAIEVDFAGPKAVEVVELISLNEPRTQGMPSAIATGSISIRYRIPGADGDSLHVLSIQDGSLLQDPNYPDVTYQQSFTLDRHWVERLQQH